MKTPVRRSSREIDPKSSRKVRGARGSRKPRYVLKLYVAGTTPRSALAIANLRSLCDEYLDGRHELEVVDIFQQPERAALNQVIAVPALMKAAPFPTRCLVGDLSDRKKMLLALNLGDDDRSVR